MISHPHPPNSFIEFSKEEIEQSIPARFEQQVNKYPTRLAVKTKSQSLTYETLNRLANRIGRAILAQRGESEEPVGLLLEPGPMTVAAIFGVLKAGKIWVPLDSALPQARLTYILRDNFFDRGGHSLLAMRLLTQIKKRLGQDLPPTVLFQAPTIEQMAALLRQEEKVSPWSSLVALRPHGSSPPFFCLPGNLGNVFTDLSYLAQYLGPDQPLYDLQDGFHNPARIEALAAHYLNEIRSVQPKGPYLLGGLCAGGVVAFEMAQQLQAQSQPVALLALIEPAPPRGLGLRAYLDFTGLVARRLIRRFGHHSSHLTRLASTEQRTYTRLKAKLMANSWALRRYAPRPYPGRFHLFLTQASLQLPRNPQLGWHSLATQGVELHELPGNHDTITGNNDTKIEAAPMQVLAEQLRSCINAALTKTYQPGQVKDQIEETIR